MTELYELPEGGTKAKSFDEPGYIYGTDPYVGDDGATYYNREDFLSLVNGDEEKARSLFNKVTWQHPATVLHEDDEDEDNEERY